MLTPEDKALILESQVAALAALEAEYAAGGENKERLRGLFNALGQAVWALTRIDGPLTPEQRRGFRQGIEIMRSLLDRYAPPPPPALLC